MRPGLFPLFICVLLSFSSCALTNKKGRWGKNALFPIHGNRFVEAIKKNASSKHVLGPTIAAGFFWASNMDDNFSNWVHHEGAIFKNPEQADNWSDHFNNIQLYEMYSVILLTPSHDEDLNFGRYLLNKTRGALTVNFASSASRYSVDRVRTVVHRQRPNQMDFKSLPSGHAAEAGSRRTLVAKGLDAIDMNEHLRFGINTVNTGMAAMTLYARIEGKRHYPSDVLLGYAFGSFISGVVYDTLINYEPTHTFSFIPMGDKYTATYTIQF